MNVLELLDELGVDRRRGGEHRNVRSGFAGIDCPWCGTIGKYHLGVHEEHGFANCWQCGPHSLFDVVAQITGDRSRAFELARQVRSSLPSVGRDEARHRRTGPLRVPAGLGPLQGVHRAYLARRGLDADLCVSLWGVQGIGVAARLPWRVWIPVHRHGRVVSWTTRSLRSEGLRYASARPDEELEPLKNLLYGMDYVRGACVVVEGPLDAWRIGPGAVATLGLTYTRAQLEQLASVPVRAVCFDSEDRAQQVGSRLADELSVFPGRTELVRLETGPDPGSASGEELAELRARFLV